MLPLELPFQRFISDVVNVDERAWTVGNTVAIHLEARGFFDALYIRFWSEARYRQNKYRDILAPDGTEWLSSLSLVVNGIQRIQPWDPKKLRLLANNTQLKRDIQDSLYFLIFGEPVDHEPAGSLFLSRTHKVQLNATIANLPIDPAVPGSRFVHINLLGIAWNILDIKNGKGVLRFID